MSERSVLLPYVATAASVVSLVLVVVALNRLDDLSERLKPLEEAEQQRVAEETERRAARARSAEARRQAVENAPRIMLDPTASLDDKVQAWRDLRWLAATAWTDSIVAEAVRIGMTASDAHVRADIWRQAHANHTHRLLLAPLLGALKEDPYRSVREEAAETLDLYLNEPGVLDALQTASTDDNDAGVRDQATRSLNRRR